MDEVIELKLRAPNVRAWSDEFFKKFLLRFCNHGIDSLDNLIRHRKECVMAPCISVDRGTYRIGHRLLERRYEQSIPVADEIRARDLVPWLICRSTGKCPDRSMSKASMPFLRLVLR